MRFDIEELVRDWLVSGRKRGDFEAKVTLSDSTHLQLGLTRSLERGDLHCADHTNRVAPWRTLFA